MFFIALGFLASLVGALSGLGGGIIIKPVLDAFTDLNASVVSFFSTTAVFLMALTSTVRHFYSKTKFPAITLYLGIGAVTGGLLGAELFQFMIQALEQDNLVKAIQNLILLLLLILASAYINTRQKISFFIENKLVAVAIGGLLGLISAFLGIGGGPINVVVLCFFFSLDFKVATANSILLILFSQASKLTVLFLTNSVPAGIHYNSLFYMAAAAVLGAIAGTALNKYLSGTALKTAYNSVMLFVILTCIFNLWSFLQTA